MSTFSDSDSDDDEFDIELQEDVAKLRDACLLVGRDSCDVPAFGGPAGSGSSDGDSASDDDVAALKLLDRIRKQYPNSASSVHPPAGDLLSSLGLIDEEEEDLAILREIQRRFLQKPEPGTVQQDGKTFATEEHQAETPINDTNTPTSPSHRPFPKAARGLFEAIRKNRQYQKFLKQKMFEIEAKIEENKELQKRAKCLLDFNNSCRKTFMRRQHLRDPIARLVTSLRPTKGKDEQKKLCVLSLGPEENPQVVKLRTVLRKNPVHLKLRSWTTSERESLAKGLRQQYQERMCVNLAGDVDGLNCGDAASALTVGLVIPPENLRTFLPLVNWDRLASMYLPKRSGIECQSRWLNCDDPMINHSHWTAQEDKKLLLIVQERGLFDWINISVALGTNRTPFQCLARYQRSLNPLMLNKEWTKEEDNQLKDAVETYGERWQLVSSTLDGRTSMQCSSRWRVALDREKRKAGRWSVEEDKILKVVMTLFGSNNWSKIAQFIPGRTQIQCRERWLNCLDPSLNLQPWTAEEDSKLLAAIEEHGYCWSKIALCISPRTDNQCRRRWAALCPKEVPLLQAARIQKRTSLLSNFADRQSGRPRIGPSDLMDLVGFNIESSPSPHLPRPQLKRPRRHSKSTCETSSSVVEHNKPGAPSVERQPNHGSGRLRKSRSWIRRTNKEKSIEVCEETMVALPSADSSCESTLDINAITPRFEKHMEETTLVLYEPPTSTVGLITYARKRKALDVTDSVNVNAECSGVPHAKCTDVSKHDSKRG